MRTYFRFIFFRSASPLVFVLISTLTSILMSAERAQGYPGAAAGEAKIYDQGRCLSSLILAGGPNEFAVVRADMVVVESAGQDRAGFYISRGGKTYLAPLKEAFAKKSDAAPTTSGVKNGVRIGAEISFLRSSNDAPLKIWYRKSDLLGRSLRLFPEGDDLTFNNLVAEESQRKPKRVQARVVSESEFGENLARQIELHRLDMTSLLTDELNDIEEAGRLDRKLRFRRTARKDFQFYVEALQTCQDVLSGAAKVATQKSLELFKQDFENKIRLLGFKIDFFDDTP